jgi:ketol-acid reductoisomerase
MTKIFRKERGIFVSISSIRSRAIAQAQADAVKSTFQAAYKSSLAAETDFLCGMVSNGTITQNQENTIDFTFSVAIQACVGKSYM